MFDLFLIPINSVGTYLPTYPKNIDEICRVGGLKPPQKSIINSKGEPIVTSTTLPPLKSTTVPGTPRSCRIPTHPVNIIIIIATSLISSGQTLYPCRTTCTVPSCAYYYYRFGGDFHRPIRPNVKQNKKNKSITTTAAAAPAATRRRSNYNNNNNNTYIVICLSRWAEGSVSTAAPGCGAGSHYRSCRPGDNFFSHYITADADVPSVPSYLFDNVRVTLVQFNFVQSFPQLMLTALRCLVQCRPQYIVLQRLGFGIILSTYCIFSFFFFIFSILVIVYTDSSALDRRHTPPLTDSLTFIPSTVLDTRCPTRRNRPNAGYKIAHSSHRCPPAYMY